MSNIPDDSSIFSYITRQESAYKQGIRINDVWTWSMKEHIFTSDQYNNSQLVNGKDEFTPVKNITRPILNLQHRTEDIDVKDVQIYVNDANKYHLSFLVKKYHDDVFVVENDIDTFFDELNISRIDFGGGLSKQLSKPCPEVVPLQSIAFCDQTDMLSGPIGIKHYYSPDQLLDMGAKGWGNTVNGATASLKDVILLAREEKKDNQSSVVKTPGRYIEVYEVHGNLPKKFADKSDDSGEYETRLFIVAFYQKPNSDEKEGVILYTKPEPESPFKLIKRDPVYGRALGFGGAEELFEPQVWVNSDMIRMQGMLDAASKIILKASGTNSATIAQKNKVRDMENLSIIDVGPDSDLSQVDTFPRNLALFEKNISNWEAHAQQMGGANDAIMGESPTAGTPFKLQELVTNESRGLHDYRRGIFAKQIEEIYNDWIIPHIQKKICGGATFLSELSLEELQYVSDALITNQVNAYVIERILGKPTGKYTTTTDGEGNTYSTPVYEGGGNLVTPEEIDAFKAQAQEQFKKKGNKHFIEILKGEFKRTPLAVKVNVAGKQKNLAGMVDKITNIFRFAFSNPQGFAQVMQIPGMAKGFNEILEFSGLSPADFSGIEKLAVQQPAQPQQMAQPSPQTQQPALA